LGGGGGAFTWAAEDRRERVGASGSTTFSHLGHVIGDFIMS